MNESLFVSSVKREKYKKILKQRLKYEMREALPVLTRDDIRR